VILTKQQQLRKAQKIFVKQHMYPRFSLKLIKIDQICDHNIEPSAINILDFRTPSGLEDVSKYPALFASLLASGAWSLEDLKKLAGLNFLRVFREVERVRLTFSVGQKSICTIRHAIRHDTQK
jgi:hypothetical protein